MRESLLEMAYLGGNVHRFWPVCGKRLKGFSFLLVRPVQQTVGRIVFHPQTLVNCSLHLELAYPIDSAE